MYSLWGEMKERCRRDLIELENASIGGFVNWTRIGRRILAITSWKPVLNMLEQAAIGGSAFRQDIAQDRGLTDRTYTAEFLPLREEEVTDANVARSLANSTGLIDEIADGL